MSTAVAVRAHSRELLTVRVATALIALHVVADAWLHPEAGTAAGDHLVSGLVPVVLLVVFALAYPRLRAWWQATLAASLGGIAAVASAGISVRHVLVDHFAGDDLTGIVAGIGALALVACGVAAARRSFRPRSADRSRVRRYTRRALLAVAVVAGLLFVVVPVGVSVLATHKAREPVDRVDLGRAYEDVSFRTADGLLLRGWYVPSRNGAAVIAFPGRSGPVRHARMLARHGYGVLLFDRRGEGESEGDFNAFGWSGEPDLVAAARYLARRPDVDGRRIGGLGLSVGGELMLQAAARSPLLAAVVADGAGYRSIRDHIPVHDRGLLSWVSPLLVQTAATAVLDNASPPPAIGDLVGDIAPRATFLIFAGKGTGGEDANPEYHDAAREPKQLWKIPEAGHTRGLAARPDEYERRVVDFFERFLSRTGR